jgi:primosomal protein N' (replication factor Y) (superfamily II helicase)
MHRIGDTAVTIQRVQVAVETPQYAGLGDLLDYESEQPLAAGTLLRVPLGRREVPGVVWSAGGVGPADIGLVVRPVAEVLASLPPLPAAWRELVAFSARYYQRALGEVALAVLPPELRKLDDAGLVKRLRKLAKRLTAAGEAPARAAAAGAERRPGGGVGAAGAGLPG